MRPKSVFAAFLCISMLVAILLTSHIFAAECVHNYEPNIIAATCINKEQIQYTCRLCGDSYSVPADAPDLPDSCYVLLKSTKDNEQLTITVTLENNPGIHSMRMNFHYNSQALRPVSRINGNVWTDRECWSSASPTENPFSYAAQYSNLTENNTKNGLICTLIFDILDDTADYNFTVTLDKKPFIDYNSNVINAAIINIVGKSEFGSHTYDQRTVSPTCTETGSVNHVCIHCGDTVLIETLPATGHQWNFTEEIISPTFESTGLALYTCPDCGNTKEETLPILEHWRKGDLNNDHELTSLDVVYMRRLLLLYIDGSPQMYDAADLDEDGVISPLDFVTLQRIVSGIIPYPPEWEW